MINAQCDRRSSGIVEWGLPSEGLTVQLAKDVLSRIQTEVAHSMAIDPHSCPGGLLVGNCCPSPSWRIRIDKFIPLEWDDSRGGAPFLMDAQLRKLTEKISSLALHTTVVGFYRASRATEYRNHDELDSKVTDAEKKLLASCFPIAGVGLGVRLRLPNLDPDVFALWEDTDSDERLAKNGHFPQPPASPIPSESVAGVPANPTVSADERRVNQQLQIAVSEKQALGPLLANLAAQPLSRKVYVQAAAWVFATVLLSLLTYIAAHLYIKPMLLNLAREQVSEKPSKGGSPTLPAQNSLGLNVSENGTALELRWDRLSPMIQGANAARLTIMDGTLLRQIDLDQDQLRSGRIIYIPVLGDVSFRLEVRNPASPPVFESIHVFNGVLSRMSEPPLLPTNSLHRPEDRSRFTSARRAPVDRNIGSATTSQAPPGSVPVAHTSIRETRGVNSVADAVLPSLPNQPPPNPVQSPREEGAPQIADIHAKSTQAYPEDDLLTPKTLSNAPAAPSSASLSQTDPPTQAIAPGDNPPQTTSTLPLSADQSAKNSQSTGTAGKQARPSLPPSPVKPESQLPSKPLSGTAGEYLPPRAVKQVQPDLRFLWPLVYKPSEIELHLKIDASGHVTAVDVPQNAAKPNQVLVNAAIAAAKGWVFQPATLRGIKVAANDTIVFRFEPRK